MKTLSFFNTITLAVILFGYGLYVFTKGSIELLVFMCVSFGAVIADVVFTSLKVNIKRNTDFLNSSGLGFTLTGQSLIRIKRYMTINSLCIVSSNVAVILIGYSLPEQMNKSILTWTAVQVSMLIWSILLNVRMLKTIKRLSS